MLVTAAAAVSPLLPLPPAATRAWS